jgi:hypothetical protein
MTNSEKITHLSDMKHIADLRAQVSSLEEELELEEDAHDRTIRWALREIKCLRTRIKDLEGK